MSNNAASNNASNRNAAGTSASQPVASEAPVVLRWKSREDTTGNANVNRSRLTAQDAFSAGAERTSVASNNFGGNANGASVVAANAVDSTVVAASGSNPLRNASIQRNSAPVRVASYYQEQGDATPFQDPFGDRGIAPPTGQDNAGMPALPDFNDALEAPEPAPAPGAAPSLSFPPQIEDLPSNPFPGSGQADSPRDRDGLGDDRGMQEQPSRPLDPPRGGSQDFGQEPLTAPEKLGASSSISCNELRDRVRNRPLSDISLDISPAYGEGLRTVRKDTEKQRLEFAANSQIREWTDYRGNYLATGRLIDLKNGSVVLDVDGSDFAVKVRDLSDVDVAYVGEAWNLPIECGIGYEPFSGRQFLASEVQWKASGLCHKPLYFEQVQLERYGHESGPISQPLLSTAHFFTQIPILPYKMGIHPPNECQYSLGYFRPGNCAPYMVQPFPWSLRGAAVQAGAVVGAAALIP